MRRRAQINTHRLTRDFLQIRRQCRLFNERNARRLALVRLRGEGCSIERLATVIDHPGVKTRLGGIARGEPSADVAGKADALGADNSQRRPV